jgi:hypothetical protein
MKDQGLMLMVLILLGILGAGMLILLMMEVS